MAQEKQPDESARSQLREFRRVLANVVSELRSSAVRDTYAAITLNEVVDQHLKELVGEGRVPSRMQRLKTTYEEFKSSIEAIKATPPSAFRLHDPKNDVNTAR